MDTLTQALLGGAIGFVVAGRQAPRKAILAGAVVAVLPDLDIFIPQANDLDAMTQHRSWTHAWLVQTAVAPLLALLVKKFDTQLSLKTWWLIIWLALITHSGLDALTVYGTQLFWPFMPPPVSGGSVFIIDPIYSLLLLAGIAWVLFKPISQRGSRILHSGFLLSCLYLLWGFAAQQWIQSHATNALKAQQIHYTHIKVSATPLNTLLWRVLVINEQNYYEGFRSVFDGDAPWEFRQYSRGDNLTDALENLPAVRQLDWFSQSLFKLEQSDNALIATDLRMGLEPEYFFRFKVAEWHTDHWQTVEPEQVHATRNARQGLQWVWQRIWSAENGIASDSLSSTHDTQLQSVQN